MKNNKMFSRLSIALVMMFVLSSVQSAFANGTVAGTPISNTASVTFTDGSNTRTKTSNTVSFFVGHKIAGSFSSPATTNTVDNKTVYIPVSFQSISNYSTNFNVSVSVAGGNTFTPSSTSLLVDDGTTIGTYQGTELAASDPQTFAENAAGTTKNYLVEVVIPVAANATTATVQVTFTNVSVDIPGDDVYVVNGTFNATVNAVVTIARPAINVTVAQTPPSPNVIPGAVVGYALSYSNTGTTDPIGDVVFSYNIPSNMIWTGLTSGSFATTNTNPVSSAAANVTYIYSAPTVTFTIPAVNIAHVNFTGGNTQTFNLGNYVKIDTANGGPIPGATLSTTGLTPWPAQAASYNDGTNDVSLTPTTSGFTDLTVGTSYGFKFTQLTANQSAGYLEIAEYKFLVRNMGNTTNQVNLTKSHVAGSIIDSNLTVFFASAPLATNGSITDNQITNVVGIAKGAFSTIYVRVLMPATTDGGTTAVSNGSTYIKNIIATANVTTGGLFALHVTIDDNVTVTTTITMNTLYISMAIDSVEVLGVKSLYTGTQKVGPGDIVTYKITVSNTSAGTISGISVANSIPTNVAFFTNAYAVLSGITIADGATPTVTTILTNSVNADEASCDGTTFRTTSANFSLTTGQTKIFRYRCTVN